MGLGGGSHVSIYGSFDLGCFSRVCVLISTGVSFPITRARYADNLLDHLKAVGVVRIVCIAYCLEKGEFSF